MKLDITSVLAGRSKKYEFSYEIDPSGEQYPIPPEGIFPTSPIKVEGCVSDSGSCLSLSASATLSYEAQCDRCADKINETVTVTLDRIIANSEIITAEDGGDYVIEEDGVIDIDLDLVEEIMLGFPSQLLCRPDCKGICAKCGCNFNYESCNCAEQSEIDPRWQVLAKLLESTDENKK